MLCIVLILIILLQPGKDSAAIFGGGQGGNKMYGARSNANPLSKATTTIAVLFMLTSITLAWYSSANAQEGSGLKDALLKEQQIMNAKDITFEVQKVYGITAMNLITPPAAPKTEAVESTESGIQLNPNAEPDAQNKSQQEKPAPINNDEKGKTSPEENKQ